MRAVPISAADRKRVTDARDSLILAHLHLVEPIARGIKRKLPDAFDVADLIAEGTLALVKAATNYRPRRHGNCPFGPYARKRIAGGILDSARRRRFVEAIRPSIDADPLLMPTCSGAEERSDHQLRLERLRVAFRRLTRDQQRILGAYYGETEMGSAAATWRRGARALKLHGEALGELRRRVAS